MARKKKKVDLPETELEEVRSPFDGFGATTEPIKTTPKEVVLETPLKEYEFDQAFRIYKKHRPDAAPWNVLALKVFCSKRIRQGKNTLTQWFLVFQQY